MEEGWVNGGETGPSRLSFLPWGVMKASTWEDHIRFPLWKDPWAGCTGVWASQERSLQKGIYTGDCHGLNVYIPHYLPNSYVEALIFNGMVFGAFGR